MGTKGREVVVSRHVDSAGDVQSVPAKPTDGVHRLAWTPGRGEPRVSFVGGPRARNESGAKERPSTKKRNLQRPACALRGGAMMNK